MTKNMSSLDRIIRALLFITVAVLYFTGTIGGTLAIVLGAVTGILLITSLVGSCPIYSLFGIRTCKVETDS